MERSKIRFLGRIWGRIEGGKCGRRAAEWQQTTGRKQAQNGEVREAIWSAERRQEGDLRRYFGRQKAGRSQPKAGGISGGEGLER